APELPLGARDETLLLVGDLDAGGGTQAQGARSGFYSVDAEPSRRLVEEHVARGLDAALEIDMAVAAALPAMELVIAERERAGTVDGEPVEPCFDSGQRHGRLEGRA